MKEDIFTFARNIITLLPGAPDDPAFRQTANSFILLLQADAQIKKKVFGLSPAADETAFKNKILPFFEEQTGIKKTPLSEEILRFLACAAAYIIVFCDTQTCAIERFLFIENAALGNKNNYYLQNAIKEVTGVLSDMSSKNFIINESSRSEKLSPVLTYLPRIHMRSPINAHLSYLSVTRDGYHDSVFFPEKISEKDEVEYLKAFYDFADFYPKIELWKESACLAAVKVAFRIIKDSPGKNLKLLKRRMDMICKKDAGYLKVWRQIENMQPDMIAGKFGFESLKIRELKTVLDFCLLLIAVALWSAGGPRMQSTARRTIERFRQKYKNNSSIIKKTALCLLSMDFAFMQNNAIGALMHDEHRSILNALKAINPETHVRPLVGLQPWARDSFAWLDEEFRLFLQPSLGNLQKINYRGNLTEGGNIVFGTAKGKFILVSRESSKDEIELIQLYLETRNRRIQMYVLPGGFTWTRNTRTKEDIILNSSHIDSVINIVPSGCTMDNRIKVIVDPHYYGMVKEEPEFSRFIREQEIWPEDVVIIDEREKYLNLANFSIVIDQKNRKMALFNNDKGYTLHRLKIKKECLFKTGIEITNISAFNGSIRCVTNVFPSSQLKNEGQLLIAVGAGIPQESEARILALFADKKHLLKHLKRSWISCLFIRHYTGKSYSEFDGLSLTLLIGLNRSDLDNPERARIFIERNINRYCSHLKRKMGVSSCGETITDAPSASPGIDCFIRRGSGQTISYDEFISMPQGKP